MRWIQFLWLRDAGNLWCSTVRPIHGTSPPPPPSPIMHTTVAKVAHTFSFRTVPVGRLRSGAALSFQLVSHLSLSRPEVRAGRVQPGPWLNQLTWKCTNLVLEHDVCVVSLSLSLLVPLSLPLAISLSLSLSLARSRSQRLI